MPTSAIQGIVKKGMQDEDATYSGRNSMDIASGSYRDSDLGLVSFFCPSFVVQWFDLTREEGQ